LQEGTPGGWLGNLRRIDSRNAVERVSYSDIKGHYLQPMQTLRTIRCKIRIVPDDGSTVNTLFDRYAQACTDIGAYGREHRESNAYAVQKKLYKMLRLRYGLSANLVITAIRKVCGNLKGSRFKGRFRYRATFVCLDPRTFTLKLSKGIVSFSTHAGRRIKATLDIGAYQHEALWSADEVQSATLVRARDGLYVNIVVRSELPSSSVGGTMGVDMGIRNLAVTSHGLKKSGESLVTYRTHRWRIRASLQSKGTKGAKRALKRLSGLERRYACWVNHNVAKEIVAHAVRIGCSLIRMELLKGIRERTKVWNRARNRHVGHWAFGQLQAFIAYKAAACGIEVEYVNPAHSSRTCHRCLKAGIRKAGEFVCLPCGLVMDSDENAALMIAAGGVDVTRPESNGRDAGSP
jgi:IS605 OrfB family transposase